MNVIDIWYCVALRLDAVTLANFACVSRMFLRSIHGAVSKLLSQYYLLDGTDPLDDLLTFLRAEDESEKLDIITRGYEFFIEPFPSYAPFVNSVNQWVENKKILVNKQEYTFHVSFTELLEQFLIRTDRCGCVNFSYYIGKIVFTVADSQFAIEDYEDNPIIIKGEKIECDAIEFDISFQDLRQLLFYAFYYEIEVRDVTDV